ncbi:MAG: D-alanine--D-alanine ligase A [Chloroflexi bacterium HGW-Chloroflexi-10]|nr:MAG: D-alanine--D-alanine ligase A [Chloroflexi bacterium HGW-Chloroflexi-10]
MKKLFVAILFGGRSGEHEISLLSARSVLEKIDRDRFEVIEVGITQEGTWLVGKQVLKAFEERNYSLLKPACLIAEPGSHTIYTREKRDDHDQLRPYRKIDVIFPVLHGTFGEDGTLQGLLELMEIAYVGAGVLGSAVGMDKALFKHVMRANQVPVLSDLVFSRKEIESGLEQVLDTCESLSAYPLFTKPANLGSSVGIAKCNNREQLTEGLQDAARYDRRVMVEKGLQKPMEIEISVLGNEFPQASVPGEIVPGDDFYTYEDKYINGISHSVIPAELPPEMMDSIRDIAIRAYKAIDCAGMARVDFLVDQDGKEIYLNELNTIPGFTQISMYSKLWEASGISYSDLITRLIDLALDRQQERTRSLHQYRRKDA